MNQLSLFIYLADVSGDIDWAISVLFFFSAIITLGSIVIGVCAIDEASFDENNWKAWRRIFFGSVAGFISTFFLGALIPQQETVYAIAASEMGEELIQTEEVGLAREALKNWIEDQIQTETE